MKKLLKTLIFTAFSLISVLAFSCCKNDKNDNSYSLEDISIYESESTVEESSDLESNDSSQIEAEKTAIFEYTEIANGTEYEISKISGVKGKVIIPSSHQGKPITSISTGAFDDANRKRLTEIVIPNSIKILHAMQFSGFTNLTRVELPSGLKEIGYSAFEYCQNLSDINLPEGLTEIPGYTFADCIKLMNVVIPDSVTAIKSSAFSNCNLVEIKIPNGVKEIGGAAFMNCSMKELFIPDSVIEIGTRAFSGCGILKDISGGESLQEIGQDVFSDTLWYRLQPDGLVYFDKILLDYKGAMPENTVIDNIPHDCIWASGVFHNCSNLSKIAIPSGLQTIKAYTFYGCTNLLEVVIPGGLKEIEELAFFQCSNLTNIHLPDSIERINRKAFELCNDLTEITLPENLEFIGDHAFSSCVKLEKVTFSNHLKTIESSAFRYCAVTSITLPDSLIELGEGAFERCKYLTEVAGGAGLKNVERDVFQDSAWYNSQPDGLVYFNHILLRYKGEMPENTVIEDIPSDCIWAQGVFQGCINLVSITLPKGMQVIPDYTFSSCTGLKQIHLSKELEEIGHYAFNKCENLTNITIFKGVDVIKLNAFMDCKSLKEIYFEGTKEEWEAIQIAEKDNEKLFNVTVIFEYTKDSIAE